MSYVGNHGINRLGDFQGGSTLNQNAVDIGAAFLPRTRIRRSARARVPGATAYTTNLLRPYRGLGNINQNTTEFCDTLSLAAVLVNRRFRNGFSFGANYTLGLLLQGQHRTAEAPPARAGRHDLAPRRPGGVRRPAERTSMSGRTSSRPNAIWDIARCAAIALGGVRRAILERLADRRRADGRLGQAYDLTYTTRTTAPT